MFIVLPLLALWALSAPIAAAEPEFPLITGMAYFPFSEHRLLPEKKTTLSLALNLSNIYSYDFNRENINDFEMFSGVVSLRYGLTPGITLELHSRWEYIYGGVLDNVIVEFHKLWGLKQGGRFDYPRNEVLYHFDQGFTYTGATSAAKPLVLGAEIKAAKGEHWDVNVRVALGLPLSAKAGFSSSKPFFSLGAILLYEKGALALSWANHGAFFSKPEELEGAAILKRMFHSELRVDYKKGFLGLLYRTSPFKQGELSNGAWQIYLGFRFLKRCEFALVEEFPPMDTTPDVTFYLKIRLI